jgi:hypothetical protein
MHMRLALTCTVLAVLATACGGQGSTKQASPGERPEGVTASSPTPSEPSGLAAARTRTGPVGNDAGALCAQGYAPAGISTRSFAFDGTVTDISPGTSNKPGKGQMDTVAVSFSVTEWWRGGSGFTATVDMPRPGTARHENDESPPAFQVGTRLLVAGEPRWGGAPLEDAIAWPCGFTRYYDERTAAEWRAATA